MYLFKKDTYIKIKTLLTKLFMIPFMRSQK
jgi:hypothetical protein